MKVQSIAITTMHKMDHGFVPDPEGETFQALMEAIGTINPSALAALSEIEAHPQTEDLEAHREELIEMAARFFTEDGVYHPADNYYIVKRGSLAGDCARIIAGYLMDITPAQSTTPSKGVEAPPVSEPVAWMDSGGAVIGAAMKRYKEMSIHIDRRESAKDYTTPLFTHPTKE